MIYIGIDNGVTGSIGVLYEDDVVEYHKMPVKSELSYTKAKQWISRIDLDKLCNIFSKVMLSGFVKDGSEIFVALERPMVNPMRFKATVSALRALEATLIAVEEMGFKYRYIDSKEWQKGMLPKGLKGEAELKKASMQIGKRLFPQIKFEGFKDADGILIAEWGKRFTNGTLKNKYKIP